MIFTALDLIKRTQTSQKVTLVGAVVDFLLAVFKIIAGFVGNSGALIADGIHSFSDLLSDGLVLYATKHSFLDADEEHPYGHKRFETVATLGLAIILAIVGLGVIFDAITRLANPASLSHSALLLSITALSIFSKEALYWYTLKVANTYKSDLLKANAWHHRSDSLSSIVVLVGIFGSLNGYPYLDSIAAIIVGLMVVYIAWKLGLGATKELVDTSIDAQQVAQLKHALGQISGVNSVHSLRTRKIGHTISCDVHVQVDPFLSVSEGHIISVSVERVAQKCLKDLSDVTVHIDVEDDEINAPYETLPERSQALGILTKALFNNEYDGEINRIQLHYLEGKIHVDFYLLLKCLKPDNSADKILAELQKTVSKLESFGKTKIYFSQD